MDQIPFCNTVENTTTSEGGKDLEDDESYRERIKITPESYSVAGQQAHTNIIQNPYHRQLLTWA